MKPETVSLIKKGIGYLGIAMAGIGAVVNALSDQKKEAEFEDMKKTISELKKMAKESE